MARLLAKPLENLFDDESGVHCHAQRRRLRLELQSRTRQERNDLELIRK